MKNNFRQKNQYPQQMMESPNEEYGKINSYDNFIDTQGDDGMSPEIVHDNESDEMMTNENIHPVNHQNYIKQSSSEEMLLPTSQVV